MDKGMSKQFLHSQDHRKGLVDKQYYATLSVVSICDSKSQTNAPLWGQEHILDMALLDKTDEKRWIRKQMNNAFPPKPTISLHVGLPFSFNMS